VIYIFQVLSDLESAAVYVPSATVAISPDSPDCTTHTSNDAMEAMATVQSVVSICSTDKGTQCPEHVSFADHSYVQPEVSHRDIGVQWEDPVMNDHDYTCKHQVVDDSSVTQQLPDAMPQATPLATSTPQKTPHIDSNNLTFESDDNENNISNISDISYEPDFAEESSSECDSCGLEEEESISNEERKFLVFESNFDTLFERCPLCGNQILQRQKAVRGTMLSVTYVCSGGCDSVWHSQPLIRRMPLGNLLVAGGILFTGGQFSRFEEFANIMKMPFISESTFYSVQNSYLFPVVESCFQQEQDALLSVFADESVWLLGDGQCDSPGHNAKYLTYTTMEEETQLILATKVVSVGEVANSNAMEVEGLHRCIEEVQAHHISIDGVATDRHPQVKYYMKTTRKDICHEFEVFHTVKGVGKELARASNTRQTEEVARWIPSITNHMWWCCATCHGDPQVRM